MKALILDNHSEQHKFKFTSVPDVMDLMKDFDNREYYHQELCKPFGLVLDDLGVEKASEYEQNQLFRILEHRKDLGKHVFMTSNLGFKQLQDKYSQRIVSRLGELMVFVENKAPSYRRTIYQENMKNFNSRIEENDKQV